MADESKVIDGTYRGVLIRISSGSVAGGRKTVIKRFPGRDTNTIEDLGGVPRSYQLEIIISDVSGQDYFSYRDSLIAALEEKGPAVLEHPLYGRIENVVCTTFSLNERFSVFGDTTVSASFEINENTGIPQQISTAVSELTTAGSLVDTSVIDDIANNFNFTSNFKDNFSEASFKLSDLIAIARKATSFIADVTGDINEIRLAIDQFESNINSLIVAPKNLALAISNLFAVINDNTGSVENTTQSFAGFFGFGDADLQIVQTTAERIERQNNNSVINLAVNSLALEHSYTNVARATFQTVAEIDTAEDTLEIQYQRVLSIGEPISVSGALTDQQVTDATSNQAVKDELTEQRVVTQRFFDEQRITARQIISVFTTPTSARLLSYQYYAESRTGDQIIQLNEAFDVSFIEGDVDILTA